MEKTTQEQQLPKVLAIDDDSFGLQILLDVLNENGFQGIGAQNGLLGLQLAKEQMPNLIICDINMPTMNGYEVLTRLRQDPVLEKIPLIFLTAEQSDRIRRRAIELGANELLTKPFTIKKLIQVLDTQLK